MTSTQYVDEAAETAQSTINRATDVWKQGTEVLAKQAISGRCCRGSTR